MRIEWCFTQVITARRDQCSSMFQTIHRQIHFSPSFRCRHGYRDREQAPLSGEFEIYEQMVGPANHERLCEQSRLLVPVCLF